MKSRRTFLKQFVTTSAAATLAPSMISAEIFSQLKRVENKSPQELSDDKDFWNSIQQAYTVDTGILNLNNGGVSPQPKVVQDAFIRMYETENLAPSYYMWRIIDQGREPLREHLAQLAGCSKEEIAINRNTTEALETIIFGLNLKADDEVILTKQDYPNMINSYKQRELRDGIKLVWLDLNLPIDDDEKIVSAFTNAFTSKTKLVHLTHVINWTGQILPVKKIADAAHIKNIEVIVDGAHSFAQLDFKIPDLNCDYFGTSLHKWLCAPFGTGMLYVKKEKIKPVWPLFGNGNPRQDDIRKFEALGTRNFATEQAIGNALTFHNMIGTGRKQERLRYLKNYWTSRVKNLPGIKFNTTLNYDRSCAICNVNFEGMDVGDLETKLFGNYKIHCSPINWENIHGVRLTPNVYTSENDLDRLVVALTEISAEREKEKGK